MTEFYLISCSKSKLPGVQLARDLYEPSDIFGKRQRLARRDGVAYGILSAKYGYLRPWDAIPAYEKHISARTSIWGAFVLRDLVRDLEYHDVEAVTILAGSRYIEPLVDELEDRGFGVNDPNEGLRPGERKSALKDALAPGEQVTLADGGRQLQPGSEHSEG